MTEFVISLAETAIEVKALHPETHTFCRDYLTDDKPEFSVSVDPEDLEAEAGATEKVYGKFSLPYLETLALYRKILRELVFRDILLFHGALIRIDEAGILFTAPSGTGKTTHIGLWKQVYGDRVTVINGDKPLIKITDQGVFGFGTPWQGKENYGCPEKVRIKAICHLTRGKENRIGPISFSEILPVLLQQSHRPAETQRKIAAMELLGRMQELDYYRLECNMESGAAITAYEGIR